LFFKPQRLLCGPAPVRRCLADLMDRVLKGAIQSCKVFDLVRPIAQVRLRAPVPVKAGICFERCETDP